jgi:hypothetical protein
MSDTVLIEVSRDVAAVFGTRTEDGRKLSFDLGQPTGTALVTFPWGVDDRPVYELTVTAIDDGMVLVQRSEDDPTVSEREDP